MNWLTRIFAPLSSAPAHTQRINDALDGIASDLETVRATVRTGFGLDALPDWSALVATAPAALPAASFAPDVLPAVNAVSAPAPTANGRKRK